MLSTTSVKEYSKNNTYINNNESINNTKYKNEAVEEAKVDAVYIVKDIAKDDSTKKSVLSAKINIVF